ncbi:hypothetical protein JZ751_003136, partial [Albula glossodonta]
TGYRGTSCNNQTTFQRSLKKLLGGPSCQNLKEGGLRARHNITEDVTKNPLKTHYNLQACMASPVVGIHESTTGKKQAKTGDTSLSALRSGPKFIHGPLN